MCKLKRSDEQPLVDRVAHRIPGWKGHLLNEVGRTTLVKATLSAIPVRTSIVLCLLPWAINMIDRLRGAFMEDAARGHDHESVDLKSLGSLASPTLGVLESPYVCAGCGMIASMGGTGN